jgi:uncharacterized protein
MNMSHQNGDVAPCPVGDPLPDVFTIPYLDGHLLYFPRRGLVFGVGDDVQRLVAAVKSNRPIENSEFNANWLHALHQLGKPIAHPAAAPSQEFRPAHVTLSLTKRCGLRCIYCYARAGETDLDLDPEIARAALRFVADNARDSGVRDLRVAFHGEGEPTHPWQLFMECVRYAEMLAEERGLIVDFSMSTNAMWGSAQRKFIAKHFRHLSISLDGLPAIQNAQRPTANGKASFDVVLENIQAMDKAGASCGIRATVLPDGVHQMVAFLEFLAAHTRIDTLTLEPVFQSGRAAALAMDRARFYDAFFKAYRNVQRRGAELGIDVTYSGCRPTINLGRFCQAVGPELNFVVMANGLVSSCYEVNEPDSDKGHLLVYGHYDRAAKSFRFDRDKLRRLLEHGVWNMPGCHACFAKWNCGGDCLARCDLQLADLETAADRSGSPRCKLNRSLTAEALAIYGMAADLLRT